ncbi:hypothetical protein ABK040_010708 [Willaertia magna]
MQQTFHTDTLHIISSFLQSRTLFSLRLVSKEWNKILTSNSIWINLFERDFGNVNWLFEKWNISLNKKEEQLTDNNNLITLKEFGHLDNLYFLLYFSVVLSIPLQIAESTKKKIKLDELYKKDYHEETDDDNSDDEYFERFEERSVVELYYYFHLRLGSLYSLFENNIINKVLLENLKKAFTCDISTHKLGVIYSIFVKNGLELRLLGPKTTFVAVDLPKKDKEKKRKKTLEVVVDYDSKQYKKDIQSECSYVMVGYEDDFDIISLSKFSYAMLCGKAEEIFKPKINYKRKDKKSKNADKEEVAVSPYIQGPFTPFCHYLHKRFTKLDNNYQKHSHYANWEEGQDWCPGFYNASFGWYYAADFSTKYEKSLEMLRVGQIQTIRMG